MSHAQSHTTDPNRSPAPQHVPADLGHELTRGYAGRMIRRKARQMVRHTGLTSSDYDDLRQSLSLALLKMVPSFDPARSSWPAFVKTILERTAAKILAHRKSHKREFDYRPVSLSVLAEDEDGMEVPLSDVLRIEHREGIVGRYCATDEELADLRADVAQIVSQLPEPLRSICITFQSKTLPEVARDFRFPRSTMRDCLDKIRDHFVEAGLNPKK